VVGRYGTSVRGVMVRRGKKRRKGKKRKERKGEKTANKVLDWTCGTGTWRGEFWVMYDTVPYHVGENSGKSHSEPSERICREKWYLYGVLYVHAVSGGCE